MFIYIDIHIYTCMYVWVCEYIEIDIACCCSCCDFPLVCILVAVIVVIMVSVSDCRRWLPPTLVSFEIRNRHKLLVDANGKQSLLEFLQKSNEWNESGSARRSLSCGRMLCMARMTCYLPQLHCLYTNYWVLFASWTVKDEILVSWEFFLK